jgi:Cys-tRNA(Pro)/Cys-tRNA(Cys) deacylase
MCKGAGNMAQVKTNAMRILDQKKVEYKIYTYDASDGKIDGLAVAEKICKPVQEVYKTLVTRGNSKSIYVFLMCVLDELDLKKAAKAAGEKSIEMIHVKDLLELTGYIRGGCSPVGMKKSFKTFIDISVKNQGKESIIISGGKIGIQLEVEKAKLVEITKAVIIDLCKINDVLQES